MILSSLRTLRIESPAREGKKNVKKNGANERRSMILNDLKGK